MRTVRLLAVAAVTMGAGLLVPAGVADAAPAAPYYALTVDNTPESGNGGVSSSFTQVSLSMDAPSFALTATDPTYGTDEVGLVPPVGTSEFTAGDTYTLAGVVDSTNAGFSLTQGSEACDTNATGSMTVEQADYDGSGNVTAFAASYNVVCSFDNDLVGEIRYASSVGYVGATETNPHLDFGQHDLGTYAPMTLTITSVGSDPIVFGTAALGGNEPADFAIDTDTCSDQSIPNGSTCSITIDPEPTGPGGFQATLTIPDNSSLGFRYADMSMQPVVGGAGTFRFVTPTRLVDTRIGTGAPKKALGAGGVLAFQVDGEAGIPSSDVSAVVLNVTETSATKTSYLTAYPDGTSRPPTSNLNFPANHTQANSVTVPVGSDGKVDIYNYIGSVQVIVDVSGYFVADDQILRGGDYQPAVPSRLLDTRLQGGPLPAHFAVTVPFTFGPDVDPQISAVVVNITAVSPTTTGYLTSWDGTGNPPTVSTLNYTKGATVPNMAVVPTGEYTNGTGTYPELTIYNGEPSGSTQVLVDIIGFFDTGSLDGGLRYHPLQPTRILDTRIGLGAHGPLGARKTTAVSAESISDNLTFGLAMNLTAVAPTASTYVAVWGDGPRPTVSTLNPAKGQTVPNATIAPLALDFTFNLYNNAGTTNLVADIAGLYDLYPYELSPNGVAPSTSGQGVRPGAANASHEPSVYQVTALPPHVS